MNPWLFHCLQYNNSFKNIDPKKDHLVIHLKKIVNTYSHQLRLANKTLIRFIFSNWKNTFNKH